MKAQDIKRPNSTTCFYDVPGTNRILMKYRTFSGCIKIVVLEPSSIMGQHSTITHLEDQCYGEAQGLRDARKQSQRDQDCYNDILSVFPLHTLSVYGMVEYNMGQIVIW